ncbi:MAG: chorismate mutase [Anaerolineales bacterium]|nr:MAG: chorismate mutase [Anaerolineales bacterium]
MPSRGIRGATTVMVNEVGAILEATRAMLQAIVTQNGLSDENINCDMVSVIFTTTTDLDAAYPAVAAREMGWTNVPLLCMQEMNVTGSLRHCIRVLIHWNTERTQSEMRHVYLGGAQALRPDLIKEA